MASAKPGVHIVQLKPVSVPKYMIDGEKFVRWDEETNTPHPVTLRVDENGFFLYWVSLNKETDLLDIATIRDTRTSTSSRLPKDPKHRSLINYGSADPLEEKTLTIVSGPDFVNLSYFTFTTGEGGVAKQWTSDLLLLSTNLLQLNSPIISFLRKMHTRLLLSTDKSGKIPVKNILKAFSSNKEDRRKVEKILSEILGKLEPSLPPTSLPFSPTFLSLYTTLTTRSEVLSVFTQFSKNPKMSADELVNFINKEQRDPRLNEILYPYATPERAKELISIYEPGKEELSFEGFLMYMMSEDNAVVSYERYDLSGDMDQPMCHYFINSSHNTYLMGHQLTGKSSVEMYRQALLAGCRCVELDFWNGPREEPQIVHGYTLVPDIPARDVIEAIAESAFKTSDYPVILSFENHCNPKQQAKIAGYCREFFGDMLLGGCLEGWPLDPGTPLPPPSLLKHKIIIKNKKKHHHHHHHKDTTTAQTDLTPDSSSSSSQSESDSESEPEEDKAKLPTDQGTAGKESEAGEEISALVNYVQPVHFYSFEASLARNRSYEMSSFDERQAMTLLKSSPVEFVNYNKHQLSRVYPRGTRVDSANFMPQLFWNAGCQLVALNYQTMDLAMQLNMGIFELNRKCGYLLKPEFMRRKDRSFDPFAESTVDGVVAGRVEIKIISSQLLSRNRTPTYIEVEMYGLPTDTIRKKFKTRSNSDSFNPIYDDGVFVFKKVVLPELACLRIVAYEESSRPLGHRVLPVLGLRPGYRHIVLRNESGQPLATPGAVFVHISVRDYVPDGLSDFAEALANPIKYQNELEKRERQLEVLVLGGEEEGDPPTPTSPTPTHNPTPSLNPTPSSPKPSSSSTTSDTPTKPWNVSIKKKTSTDTTPPPGNSTTLDLSGPPPPPALATYGNAKNSKNCHLFYVEGFESYLRVKGVREKMGAVGKKVEALRRSASGGGGSGVGGVVGKGRSLVKKMSKMDLGGGVADAEREVIEKGVEELSRTLSTQITSTHSKQLKLLSQLKDRQSAEIMKWIYAWRKDEYRRLSKLTRDKNELGRMKREVNNLLVAKGVVEREKVEENFADIEIKLLKDQEIVLKDLEKWRGDRGWVEGEVGRFMSGDGGGVVKLLKFRKE